MLSRPLMDKEGNPIKEPKRTISKKLKHMEEYLAFPDNYDSWKKVSKGFRFRVENESIFTLVQAAIREYNENYKDITLLDLRTNKKTRPSTWLCTVDGIGSNFCLNKGKNHTTSSIYFIITPEGNLYHKCNSPKPIERPYGNKYCSDYCSTHRPLPDLVKDCLTWKKKDTTEFGTVDEQLHFQKFVSKHKDHRLPSIDEVPSITSPSPSVSPPPREKKVDIEEGEGSLDTHCPEFEKIDVDRDAREIALIVSTLKEKKPRLDEVYMRNLYLLNFKCMYAIDGFDKSEKKVEETDIRHIRLSLIPDKRALNAYKALQEKEEQHLGPKGKSSGTRSSARPARPASSSASAARGRGKRKFA